MFWELCSWERAVAQWQRVDMRPGSQRFDPAWWSGAETWKELSSLFMEWTQLSLWLTVDVGPPLGRCDHLLYQWDLSLENVWCFCKLTARKGWRLNIYEINFLSDGVFRILCPGASRSSVAVSPDKARGHQVQSHLGGLGLRFGPNLNHL